MSLNYPFNIQPIAKHIYSVTYSYSTRILEQPPHRSDHHRSYRRATLPSHNCQVVLQTRETFILPRETNFSYMVLLAEYSNMVTEILLYSLFIGQDC